MTNQLKVQFYKLRKFPVFYLIAAGLSVLSIMYAIKTINVGTGWSGAYALLASISDTSLMFAPALLASYFIGVDFETRTIHNEIRIGYNRFSAILSRGFVTLSVSVLLYLLSYTIPITVITSAINGFGTGISVQEIAVKLILFSFQMMAIQSFTILFVFVSKKATLGMLISVCFAFITCNLLRNLFGENNPVFALTSFYRIMMNNGNMTSADILISFASAVTTLFIVFCITYMAFQKAELK